MKELMKISILKMLNWTYFDIDPFFKEEEN